MLSAVGDKDAGSGGDSLCFAVDALSDAGGGQLLPQGRLSGHLVPSVLPSLHLHEQRHQPYHLQCHVAEVSRRLPKTVPLRAPALREAPHLQRGPHVQRHQGDLQWRKPRPLHHRARRHPRSRRRAPAREEEVVI